MRQFLILCPWLFYWKELASVVTNSDWLGADPGSGDPIPLARGDGGLDLGTAITTSIFLGLILIMVVFLSITR